MAEDALDNLNKHQVNAFKNECISEKRRRKSIEFYRQLFNVNNFDNNGRLLTAKKRKKRRNKLNKHRKRLSYRNDSANLEEHRRSWNIDFEIDDIDDYDANDISLFDDEPQIRHNNTYRDNNDNNNNSNIYDQFNHHQSSQANLNIARILNSKIYDDNDKKAVRDRYRYILYFPMIIYIIFGIVTLVLSQIRSDIDEIYTFIMYGYPGLEIILSIVLWCQIDIVILSCGGSHIVEECLEVQISANGHEYKCIYCCWCDCAVLRFCNSCTHDNGYSLFKCHHKFMKILICLICPLLTIVYYITSEIQPVYNELTNIKIGDLRQREPDHNNDPPPWLQDINNAQLYTLVFVIVSALYMILIFTAIYIGGLIVKSLYFVSSLSPQTLIMQYCTSIMITFLMQIQFVILLLYYNLSPNTEKNNDGLCSATAFYLLLVYVEFIAVSILNHFSFRHQDFHKFGREAIKENEVQLFDFDPKYEEIHDLHNYRRIYGEKFLWDLDHKDVPFGSAPDNDDDTKDDNDDSDDNNDNPNTISLNIKVSRSNKSKRKSKNQKVVRTPLITKDGVITIEDAGRPSSTRNRKKSQPKKSKKTSSKNLIKKKSKSKIDEKKNNDKKQTTKKQNSTQQEKNTNTIELESVIDDEIDSDKKIRSRPASTRYNNNKTDNKVILPTTTTTANNITTSSNDKTENNELPKDKHPSMNNDYQTNENSLSLSYQNATFTQTTQKETGHHHPTTTTSLSLSNQDELVGPYSLDERNEPNSSSNYDDNSWDDDDDNDSSPWDENNESSPNSKKSKKKSKRRKTHQKDKSLKIKDNKSKKNKSKKVKKENSKRDETKHKDTTSKTSNSSSNSSNSSITKSKLAKKSKQSSNQLSIDLNGPDNLNINRTDSEVP